MKCFLPFRHATLAILVLGAGLGGGSASAQENPQVNLTTGVIGGGTIERVPDQTFYDVGTTVSLTAIADDGFVFESWSGPVADPLSPVTTVLLKTNTLVGATFVAATKPTLKTTPDAETPLDFGVVETGLLSNPTFRSITVTNVGGGILEGTAVIRTGTERPYGIVSGESFRLEANESAQIQLRFDPFNVDSLFVSIPITGVLDISSNGGNAEIRLAGIATVSSELGCSCATTDSSSLPWGNLLLLLMVLGCFLMARPGGVRAPTR